jgi:hypothetical protein
MIIITGRTNIQKTEFLCRVNKVVTKGGVIHLTCNKIR